MHLICSTFRITFCSTHSIIILVTVPFPFGWFDISLFCNVPIISGIQFHSFIWSGFSSSHFHQYFHNVLVHHSFGGIISSILFGYGFFFFFRFDILICVLVFHSILFGIVASSFLIVCWFAGSWHYVPVTLV